MEIESFILELEANGRSKHTIQSYKDVLNRLSKFKPLQEITKPDLIRFFKDFKGTDETKRLYQAKIKKFFMDQGKDNLVSWIKLIKISESLNSDEVLSTDDINKLLESTDSIYYKAWISLSFESGARFNEIKQLRYKDLKETSEGLIVAIPTSKNDAIRPSILLSASANYLRNLKAHSMMNETDIVFPLSRQGLAKHLEEISAQAGIKKPVTPHRFRHAQATDMVKRNYTEAIIKAKLGWKKNSRMASRYTHLDDNSVIDATLRATGKLPENRKPITEIKEADKISLIDSSMQLNRISQENSDLKQRMEKNEGDLNFFMGLLEEVFVKQDMTVKEAINSSLILQDIYKRSHPTNST